MDKILIVDDNESICQALALLLELHGYQAVCCHSPEQALPIVSYQRIALVIQDMNFSADITSGEEGKTLFYQLRELQPQLPVILLTAWTQLEMAVALVKDGAADYLAKPWDDSKLLLTIKNLLELSELKQQNQTMVRQRQERQQALSGYDLCGLVYESTAMQRVVDTALQVANSDVSVMITGANGSGKEKIAEILQANSGRKLQPFVKVNLGAIPADLLEAELFGAEAGAYTGINKRRIGRFEAAEGGTLFLDEVGELPLSGQVKLLRVLQTGEYQRLGSHETLCANVRVVSATNADLQAAIANGTFREDLYYRLNVIQLAIAPLSKRSDDILPLCHHFIGSDKLLSKTAEQALLQHAWPGNVRELENSCQRARLLSQSDEYQPEDFGLVTLQNKPDVAEPDEQTIRQALAEHQGVIARAAKSLSLSRQALYRRMEKFNLTKDAQDNDDD